MSRLHDSEPKYRKPAAAVGALMATVLLAACGTSEAAPGQTNNATTSASASATPGTGESSTSSPSVAPSESSTTRKEIVYLKSETPPVPTNFDEAKGVANWYTSQVMEEKSVLWDVLDQNDASFFTKHKIGKADIENNIDYFKKWSQVVEQSQYNTLAETKDLFAGNLAVAKANEIILQSILDNPAIADKLQPDAQQITYKDFHQRSLDDKTQLFSVMFGVNKTKDPAMWPDDYLIEPGVLAPITDELIRSNEENRAGKTASSVESEGLGWLILQGSELNRSCTAYVSGEKTSCSSAPFTSVE